MDYSCTIYISGYRREDDLISYIKSLSKGTLKGETIFVHDFVEIDVDENEEYDVRKEKEFPDGFLFFPYRLDIEFNDKIVGQNCVDFINLLLKSFWGEKKSAIAACDYEDELINNGGYNHQNIPFPV